MGNDLFRIATLATGLALIAAMGPASASAAQGPTKTCEVACGNLAVKMMGQSTSTQSSSQTEHRSTTENRSGPAYTPAQVLDFLKKCYGNCESK